MHFFQLKIFVIKSLDQDPDPSWDWIRESEKLEKRVGAGGVTSYNSLPSPPLFFPDDFKKTSSTRSSTMTCRKKSEDYV
jgi:hypothetical protein